MKNLFTKFFQIREWVKCRLKLLTCNSVINTKYKVLKLKILFILKNNDFEPHFVKPVTDLMLKELLRENANKNSSLLSLLPDDKINSLKNVVLKEREIILLVASINFLKELRMRILGFLDENSNSSNKLYLNPELLLDVYKHLDFVKFEVEDELRLAYKALTKFDHQILEFNFSFLARICTFISTLIFINSYIYNTFFFKYFGVDISYYFSLSDYLIPNLNEIILNTFISLVIGSGMLFFLNNKIGRTPFIEYGLTKHRLLILFYVILLSTSILHHVGQNWHYFSSRPRVIWAYLIILTPYLFGLILRLTLLQIFSKIFKNFLYAYTTTAYSIIVISLMTLIALYDASSFKANVGTKVFLQDAENYELKGFSLLKATSNHYLMLNDKTREVKVISKGQVKYIEHK